MEIPELVKPSQDSETASNQSQDNPWLAMAGMWDPQDPLVHEWKQIMEEKRRSEDADAEAS